MSWLDRIHDAAVVLCGRPRIDQESVAAVIRAYEGGVLAQIASVRALAVALEDAGLTTDNSPAEGWVKCADEFLETLRRIWPLATRGYVAVSATAPPRYLSSRHYCPFSTAELRSLARNHKRPIS